MPSPFLLSILMVSGTSWRVVELRSVSFHATPAVQVTGDLSRSYLWELAPFFFFLAKGQLGHWLGKGHGAERVARLAEALCPGLPCVCHASRRSAAAAEASRRARRRPRQRENTRLRAGYYD